VCKSAPSTDPVSVEARLEGYAARTGLKALHRPCVDAPFSTYGSYEYPKEWIFSKNLSAYGSVPKLVAPATVSKLNIWKRYGKSGVLPAWVYDLPLKNALKADLPSDEEPEKDPSQSMTGRRARKQVRIFGMLLMVQASVPDPFQIKLAVVKLNGGAFVRPFARLTPCYQRLLVCPSTIVCRSSLMRGRRCRQLEKSTLPVCELPSNELP